MYGLVNQAIKDMVIERFGDSKWAEICSIASCPSEDFQLMQSYPDTITYGLVGGASRALQVQPEALLEEFGEYWIRFTADKGYGELLNLFGSDLRACLKNLNHMHARMGAMMPELQPPRFSVEEQSPGTILLRYFSKRAGLAPMVVGLLRGLARRHGNEVSIVHHPRTEGQDHECFSVTIHH